MPHFGNWKKSLKIVFSATDSIAVAGNGNEQLNIAQHYLLLGKANKAELYVNAVFGKISQ